MQLHEKRQAVPVLVRQGMKSAFSCMQNHAPYACTRNLRLASQEKGCLG
ncbi:acetyl xylan esterase [Serratia rhizosphaerae]|uniref:Acetyl xylan esterase n=1 Tax=Serratia rhizosphaerae TaxID=2597702 RepID=A0ABX6GKM8_9GAMM|nr:acetyl xylan esterase [Serratia rhizosphaerae]